MTKIYIIILLLCCPVFAQGEKNKAPVKDSDKLEYTKEEFSKAVYDELEKKMKKIGRLKLLDFAKELLEKEDALEKREREISVKDEQVKISQEDLKKKIVEFKVTQSSFLACIDKDDQDQKNRITHMVNVVSSMRPQTAASLLSQQDPTLSVKILGMLDATKVSKIFNLMDKEISAKLQKQYMTMKK